MNLNLSALLKSYDKLPEMHRLVIDLISVKFSGLDKYNDNKFLQNHINAKLKVGEYNIILKDLTRKGFVITYNGRYDVPLELKLELFPKLIQEPKYTKIIRKEQLEDSYYSWNIPVTQYIRDYLFASFVEENRYTEKAQSNLLGIFAHELPCFFQMLTNPIYDKALIHSPQLFFNLMLHIQSNNSLYFQNFEVVERFFDRNKSFRGTFRQLEIFKAEITFHRGNIQEAFDSIDLINNNLALMLKSQIELFRGNFTMSVAAFEKARIPDQEGEKCSRMEFSFYHEFFYWLNFLFHPEGLNFKRLESAIKKGEKGDNNYYILSSSVVYPQKRPASG